MLTELSNSSDRKVEITVVAWEENLNKPIAEMSLLSNQYLGEIRWNSWHVPGKKEVTLQSLEMQCRGAICLGAYSRTSYDIS